MSKEPDIVDLQEIMQKMKGVKHMVPFVAVNNITKTPQYAVVERFVNAEFWKPEFDDLFAPDIRVEFPHAVPGMPMYMIPYEFNEVFRFWLCKTVKSHKAVHAPCIIPTTDPDLFWAIRQVEDAVYWAKKDGVFRCEFADRIVVKDGRIAELREYANPVAFYNAIDIVLPNFNFLDDIVKEAPSVRMGKDQASHFTREENVARAVANFANPINGHDEDPESIYAHDMIEVCPFVPRDMPESYVNEEFDIQTEWMFRCCVEWETIEKVPFYQSVDPNIIIVESYGRGRMLWSNHEGHYTQRELQIVHLDQDGKIDHFRVYFNSLNKFFSMNQILPAFPYFNY